MRILSQGWMPVHYVKGTGRETVFSRLVADPRRYQQFMGVTWKENPTKGSPTSDEFLESMCTLLYTKHGLLLFQIFKVLDHQKHKY